MPNQHDHLLITDLEQILLSSLSSVCEIPMNTIDIHQPLIAFGIDSMIAIHLNQQLKDRLGLELPFELIAQQGSLKEVAQHLLDEIRHPAPLSQGLPQKGLRAQKNVLEDLSDTFYDIKKLAQYKKITLRKTLFKKANIEIPYYRAFDSASTDTISYHKTPLINFASYNYLGYNTHPLVNQATKDAIDTYGTSAASSRTVSGEKLIHQELEASLADLYQVEDALVFVSGYATNVNVISHLMERHDLILHDDLAHNSIVMGCALSQAKRLKFPHNDLHALEQILIEHRLHHHRVLIIVEGLYSMDGDTAPLKQLVALKKKYKCLLMVDEAHSIGVLGTHGLGLREHADVHPEDVDIWMGTLSKTFAGCGGYIAGCWALIDYIKYTAPGFIFSVGLAPPLAAASLKALELLKNDTQAVKKLQDNSQYFLRKAKANDYDTGLAEGYAIIPIILGHSLDTAKLSNTLFEHGINVQPIIYPGVEEASARLRFFISSLHTQAQIDRTFDLLARIDLRIGYEHDCSRSEA